MCEQQPTDLSLLEILSACPDNNLEEGRVEATGLALIAHDALHTAHGLPYTEPNGSRAASPALVRAIFTEADAGSIRRCGMSWQLTDHGRALLEAANVTATEKARALIGEFADLSPTELFAEADRLLRHR
jgi:hypothetical protein